MHQLFFTILLFGFLSVLMFYMLMPCKERFVSMESGSTRYSMYRDMFGSNPDATGAMFDDMVRAYDPLLDDANDMLHMKRCLQFFQPNLHTINHLKNYSYGPGMYDVKFDMVTCSFNEVRSRIVCELQKFQQKIVCKNTKAGLNRACESPGISAWNASTKCPIAGTTSSQTAFVACGDKVKGPVYVLITQAPYYRNSDNNPITVQFNIDSFGYLPYNVAKPTPDDNVPIYYHVQLLFDMYKNNGQLRSTSFMTPLLRDDWDKNHLSSQKQCFLRTKNSTEAPSLPGGCGSNDGAPYPSTCLGPDRARKPNEGDKSNKSTYAILYEINPLYEPVKGILG